MASPSIVTDGIRMNTVAATTLSRTRYLERLDADFARFRSLVFSTDAPVPSCPGWSTTDLAEHMARVYWHQSYVVKNGAKPEGEEHLPDITFSDSPQRFLDLSFEAIRKALDPSRSPEREVWTFDPASTTVDFWFRRMAHETMIHRFDAELAARAITAFDDELALDGIDELMSWVPLIPEWSDAAQPDLGSTAVTVEGTRTVHYSVAIGPGGCTVVAVDSAPRDARVRIIGSPQDVDLLLWGRMPASNPRLIVDGEPDDVSALQAAIRVLCS